VNEPPVRHLVGEVVLGALVLDLEFEQSGVELKTDVDVGNAQFGDQRMGYHARSRYRVHPSSSYDRTLVSAPAACGANPTHPGEFPRCGAQHRPISGRLALPPVNFHGSQHQEGRDDTSALKGLRLLARQHIIPDWLVQRVDEQVGLP